MSFIQETFNHNEVQFSKPAELRIYDKTVISSLQTVSISDLKSVFFNHFIRSSTSIYSSINEDLLLEIKILDLLRMSQNRSEIMNDQELKVVSLRPCYMTKDIQPENLTSQKDELVSNKVNRNDIYNDTLAILERSVLSES